MNAVNLIPRDAKRRGATVSLGAPVLGLLTGLLIILAATVLFVTAHDRVSSRRTELATLSAGTAQWSAAAARYSADVATLGQQVKQISEVRQLAAQRFDWSLLLGQLATVIPARAQLSSLQAGSPASADAAASANAPTTSTPGIQLTACAASQTVVAQTMVALRRVTGISQVTLSSSASNGSGAASASGGGGDCRYPVQFQLTLSFATGGAASSAAAATAGTGTAAPGVTQ